MGAAVKGVCARLQLLISLVDTLILLQSTLCYSPSPPLSPFLQIYHKKINLGLGMRKRRQTKFHNWNAAAAPEQPKPPSLAQVWFTVASHWLKLDANFKMNLIPD